jgi:hypothetical protein
MHNGFLAFEIIKLCYHPQSDNRLKFTFQNYTERIEAGLAPYKITIDFTQEKFSVVKFALKFKINKINAISVDPKSQIPSPRTKTSA